MYNLKGKKFGRWTVIEKAERPKHIKDKDLYWLCKCECGTERIVNGRDLRNNKSTSCGCLRKETLTLKLKKDLTGKRFGKLVVLKEIGESFLKCGTKNFVWECQCDCGNKINIPTYALTSGKSNHCGCMTGINISNSKFKQNTYDLTGDYGIGHTINGEKFYFDLEDYNKIKDYYWYRSSSGYILHHIKHTNDFIIQHRLIMGVYDDTSKVVDHMSHNTTDNRKINLRICTVSNNNMNATLRSNNTSGCTGVSWFKLTNQWRARITINYTEIELGLFDDYEDAIIIRKEAEEIYFGRYSYDNSIKKANELNIPIITEEQFLEMINK